MTKLLYGTEEELQEIESVTAFRSEKEITETFPEYEGTLVGLEEGKIVKGEIVRVTDNDVYVDVRFKSEGIIPRSEFKDTDDLTPGTQVEVCLEQIEDKDGQIILSKARADFLKVWDEINEAYESGKKIKGKVVRKIKGGVIVDVVGIETFLPGSQIDLRAVPDLDSLVGQTIEVKVIKVNKIRRNIVVSRRIILETERSQMRNEIIETLEIGQTREGTVKNITDFGAFVDLGGVDGLLHITDMSWGRVNHPSEVVKLGEKIQVVILDFNEKKERISLGRKQLNDHPWKNVSSKFPEGSTVKGKIVSITDYGAFMQIDEGIEGLIHISEMSWTQNIKHPSQILKVGDVVQTQVLKLDETNQKISLGLKQTTPDPWEGIEEELPVGSKVTGTIRNLAAFGAFIEIKEGVDGLIHVSDMSWTKKINHPSEILKKGDKVDLVILAVDKEKRRISLSMKHLHDDPWETIMQTLPKGTEIKGKVIRLLDRGAVVQLDNDMEGFIPNNKLTSEKIKKAGDICKVDDELPAVVTDIDISNRKLTLSVVDYFKNKEDAEWKEYLETHPVPKTSIGDEVDLEQHNS
ncbi:30S ribosomal protein S1 [Fibrobacterota bacterium]